MGPKKKGKQNKLARMSDEERLRYLQHKAAMEEEARRRKQQLIATFVKSKLKREEAFTRLNQAKIHEQWRHILRKAKCKELQQELEMSRQSFEYLLERKEQVIKSLQGDLQESESQYMVILQAHMEAVDRILLLGSRRIEEQANIFKRDQKNMLERAKHESQIESQRNKQAQQLLSTVIFATREAASATEQSMKTKALKKRTDILNLYNEEMQALQLRLGSHLENLQEQLLAVFRNYTANTQEQRRMYEEMKERDSESIDIIASQASTITKLQSEVDKLQSQLEKLNIGSTPRTSKLENQEKQLSAECWRQRKQQQNITKYNELKIKLLTSASSICIEKLEKMKIKGDSILKIAYLCSRLETEEEKVILSHPLPIQEESSAETSESTLHDTQELPDDHCMSNFWRRHSQALLSRAALRMHHDTLMQENTRLRNALRHYLSATATCMTTTTPSSAPSTGQTPLLVARRLRGRRISLIPLTETRPPRTPVCIEAAIAVKTMLK